MYNLGMSVLVFVCGEGEGGERKNLIFFPLFDKDEIEQMWRGLID